MYKNEELFTKLCLEVGSLAPGSQLGYKWQKIIENLGKAERYQMVNEKDKGSSPLFIASKRDLADVVSFLHIECGADLEQKGLYSVPDDSRTVHFVTPLWCAAVANNFNTVKVLVKLGANINSVSDTGSTAVRSACFMTNFKVVRFLVLSGADIQLPNFNGGTCLINSVQNADLCKFLIDHGANVNARDVKGKTALHYAIEENRLDTVEILIKKGADPFIKNRLGDDALQTACIKGAYLVFIHLLKVLDLTPERTADAHELIGASYFDELSDINEAIEHWKIASAFRKVANVNKTVAPPRKAFNYCKEFIDDAELEDVLLDHDSIKMQSLLMTERILGKDHKDTIFRIMYRGASYADSLQYTRCWRLWLYVLELKIKKETILFSDTCTTAQAVVRLFMDLSERFPSELMKLHVSFEDVFEAIQLIGGELFSSLALLKINPVYNKQQLNYDRMLIILLYFLHFILKLDATRNNMNELAKYFHLLLKNVPCTVSRKDTLLHIAVIKSVVVGGGADGFNLSIYNPFPNCDVVNFLLDCGADINTGNIDGASPLYLAASSRFYNKEIFELLMARGAHLDQATHSGSTPIDVLNSFNRDDPDDINVPILSLKCLASRVIKRTGIEVRKGVLPSYLLSYINLH